MRYQDFQASGVYLQRMLTISFQGLGLVTVRLMLGGGSGGDQLRREMEAAG